jgi:hypothetical protein
VTENDTPRLIEVLAALADLYRTKLSKPMLDIWVAAMRPYPLGEIQRALSWHTTHGEAGQFMPKPADIVRHIQGSAADHAMLAWSKTHDAIRLVGPWASPVFDDPLIHVVIRDLGGWIALNAVTSEELPFREREFITRYRSAASRNAIPPRVPRLTGISEAENSRNGKIIAPPTLVGDRAGCVRTFERLESDAGRAQITAGEAAKSALTNMANGSTMLPAAQKALRGPQEP